MPVQIVYNSVFGPENESAIKVLAIGLAANGRLIPDPTHTTLMDRYPAFMSDYRKRAKAGLLVPGTYWVWRDSRPILVGLITRETPQGPARSRYIETALTQLNNNAQHEGLHEFDLLPLAASADWPALQQIVERVFAQSNLVVTIHSDR